MHDLIDFVGLKYITFASIFSQFTVENLHRAQKRRKNTIFSQFFVAGKIITIVVNLW